MWQMQNDVCKKIKCLIVKKLCVEQRKLCAKRVNVLNEKTRVLIEYLVCKKSSQSV